VPVTRPCVIFLPGYQTALAEIGRQRRHPPPLRTRQYRADKALLGCRSQKIQKT
jgi:hypothetical protein